MERQRSLWAWGWQDKFPDEAGRTGIAQLARMMVPTAQVALRPLPAAEPTLAAPAISVPAGLAAFASQDPRDRAAHARGRAFVDLVAGFAGDYAAAPDLV